ncbi:hypothetical protein NQD34_007701 [Periophthalmus magnuspinnatus]|nr:hypothetical protein NQD34_007701 [Periophthalmus magnuspinnatus]
MPTVSIIAPGNVDDISCKVSICALYLYSSVVQTIVSGVWSYNLTMKAYLDWSRTLPILPETILHLDQTVWVQLNTSGLDYTLVSVVTESCWATRNPQPNSTPRYDLVIHG